MDIKNIERDMGKIIQKLESQDKWLVNINKILSGNGREGLVAQFNQWKGTTRFMVWGLTITAPLITGLLIVILRHVLKGG